MKNYALALVLVATLAMPVVAPTLAYAQTPTVQTQDEAKYQLIQLLLQLIALYQAQLEAMQSEPILEEPEEEIVEEREVIEVTSQNPNEFVEREEDLDRTVTLATFSVYAEKEDLDGSTFRALVRDLPYGKPAVKYTCPDVIKKGDTRTCRIKVTGVGGYSAIRYSIQDVLIEATDGSDYKGKFSAVEGIIKDK